MVRHPAMEVQQGNLDNQYTGGIIKIKFKQSLSLFLIIPEG
jgi:hypothetical protein